MIKYDNVITLEKNELKNITIDTVKFNKNTASHCNRIKNIADALTKELDAYKKVAKEKANFTDYEDKVFTVENKPRETFCKDDFIAVYGEDEYKRFCKKLPQLYVTFKG